jgi:hypothetical protein
MAYTPFAAGQRLTANTLNAAVLSGVLIFRAYRSAAQTIPTRSSENLADALQWDEVSIDRLGGWSSGSPTRFTCTTAGWHTFSGGIGLNSQSGGTVREAVWYLNGALMPAGRSVSIIEGTVPAGTLTADGRRVSILMAFGDYVEFVPYQNSGSSIDTASGSYRPFISVHYAGPS